MQIKSIKRKQTLIQCPEPVVTNELCTVGDDLLGPCHCLNVTELNSAGFNATGLASGFSAPGFSSAGLGPTGFVTPKAIGGFVPHSGHRGVFAQDRIYKGELIAMWGGEVLHADAVANLDPSRMRLTLQVDDDLYLVSTHEGPADWINHSCDPNAGLSGQIGVVALRDIEQNDEICFDYAMTDSSPYDEFACCCGANTCRGIVTGNDWQLQRLWVNYAGHFSPYLERRILELRRVSGRRRRRPVIAQAG